MGDHLRKSKPPDLQPDLNRTQTANTVTVRPILNRTKFFCMHCNTTPRPPQGSSGNHKTASLRAINKFKHPRYKDPLHYPNQQAKTAQGNFSGVKKSA